jgi:hypothetical protein
MTTVVNTPASSGSDNSGNGGLFIGIFILVILGLLFFYFGIPAIKKIGSGQITTPQIVVPDKIDVNVKQTN